MKFLILHLENSERFLLMTTVINEIKRIYANAEVDLIYKEKIPEEFLTCVTNCIKFPDSFFKQFKLIRSLGKYTILIDVQRTEFKQLRRFVRFISAEKKIGYNKPGKRSPFNLPLSKTKENHLLDYYLKVFDALDVPRPPRKLSLFSLNTDLGNRESKKVLIYLSEDGWDEKNWFMFLSNHNVILFKITLIVPSSKTKLKEIITLKFKTIDIYEDDGIDSMIKHLSYSDYVLTEDSYLKYLVSLNNIPLIQLDNKAEADTDYPLTEEYYVVKPKVKNGTIKDISFDTLLLAFREMTMKF